MLERLVKIAAKVNNVSEEEVLQPGSNEAKQMLCYCLYTAFRMTQAEIAELLKLSNHSAASKLIDKAEFYKRQYKDYQRKLSDVLMLSSRERERDVYDRLLRVEQLMISPVRKRKATTRDEAQLELW